MLQFSSVTIWFLFSYVNVFIDCFYYSLFKTMFLLGFSARTRALLSASKKPVRDPPILPGEPRRIICNSARVLAQKHCRPKQLCFLFPYRYHGPAGRVGVSPSMNTIMWVLTLGAQAWRGWGLPAKRRDSAVHVSEYMLVSKNHLRLRTNNILFVV